MVATQRAQTEAEAHTRTAVRDFFVDSLLVYFVDNLLDRDLFVDSLLVRIHFDLVDRLGDMEV